MNGDRTGFLDPHVVPRYRIDTTPISNLLTIVYTSSEDTKSEDKERASMCWSAIVFRDVSVGR